MTIKEYQAMLVSELRMELKQLGLTTSGNKVELIKRLNDHQSNDSKTSIENKPINDYSKFEKLIDKMKINVFGPLNVGSIILIGISLFVISSVLFFETL